MAGVATFFYLK